MNWFHLFLFQIYLQENLNETLPKIVKHVFNCCHIIEKEGFESCLVSLLSHVCVLFVCLCM